MSICPRCRAPLVAGQYRGVDLEACSRCGGRWLTHDDLKSIADAAAPSEADAPQAPAPGGPVSALQAKEVLPCPSCGRALEPFNYAGDSGIILDTCPVCDRLWLDAGRLEAVRQTVAASRRGLEWDIKRLSGTLHEVEVREDAIEQQSTGATPSPSVNPIPIHTGNEKGGR